ncbi:hypothetical protein [Geodermatophilus sp. URMC 65]
MLLENPVGVLAGLRAAGRRRLLTVVRKAAGRWRATRGRRPCRTGPADRRRAGSAAAEKVLPRPATSLAGVLAHRRAIAAEVEGSSMPTLLPGS